MEEFYLLIEEDMEGEIEATNDPVYDDDQVDEIVDEIGMNLQIEVSTTAKVVDLGAIEYDSDDNPIAMDKQKIKPIPILGHSTMDYKLFNKDFYEENSSISGMSDYEVSVYQKTLAIRVLSFDMPKPIKLFEDCGFPSPLMGAIAKQAYEKPTTIQCQARPIVLSGRDIIDIAKIGLGKTAAFVLPMIVHIMDQPEVGKGQGLIGVICAPTRELTHQMYLEAKQFSKPYGLRVAAVYGGVSKLDQFRELKAGFEIVVATLGRLIDLLKMKALTMTRATYLVLDEADRIFDLDFEPHIRYVVGQIRFDRLTLLFTTTMLYKVEQEKFHLIL